MPFSKPAVEKIRDKIEALVSGWEKSDHELCGILNNRDIPNPTPQPQIPRQMLLEDAQVAEAIALIANATARTRVLHVLKLAQAIRDNDKPGAASALADMVTDGTITAADRTAMIDYYQENVPDPTWPALISWVRGNLSDVRDVDWADIQNARRLKAGLEIAPA